MRRSLKQAAFLVFAALGLARAAACTVFGTGTAELDGSSPEASANSPDSTTDGGASALEAGSPSDAAADAKRVGAFCDQPRPDAGKITFCDDFEKDRVGGWFPQDSLFRVCNDGGVTSDDAGPVVGPNGDSCAFTVGGILGNAAGSALERDNLEHLQFTTRIRLVTTYVSPNGPLPRRLGFFKAIPKQCEDFSLDAYPNDGGMADIRLYKGTLSGTNWLVGSAAVGEEMDFDINLGSNCNLGITTNLVKTSAFSIMLQAKPPAVRSVASFRLDGEWGEARVTVDNVLHEFAR